AGHGSGDMSSLLAFPVRSPAQPGLEIRVNFGMFAGREATSAEIEELGAALLPEIGTAAISSENRYEIGPESEAEVHQVRIGVPHEKLPGRAFQMRALSGNLV